MTHQRRKRLVTGAILLLFLAFWLYLAWCVPYSQDDWDWGLAVGMEQWLTASLNNRYAGSFFAVIMTRSTVVKVLILGGGMFAIPLLMSLLCSLGDGEERRPFLPLYLAANLVTLVLPSRIWRQTYGWVSGFANYGVSIVFFLLWLLLLLRALSGDREEWNKALAILPVYTALLALFLENLAVINLLLALCFFLYTLVTERGRALTFGVLMGAVVGCVLVFRNPLYGDLAATGTALGGLRNLIFPAGSPPAEMVAYVSDRLFGYLIPLPFSLGMIFPFLLALVTILSLWRRPFNPLCILAVWPMIYGALMTYHFDAGQYQPLKAWGGVLSLVIPCLAAGFSPGPLPRRLLRAVLLLGGFGMIAPMALVWDIGGRTYLMPYLLTALVVLDLAAPLLGKRTPVSGALCAALALAVMFQWVNAYTTVAGCSALRKQLILDAMARGAQEVVVPTDRYELVIEWYRNPEAAHRVIFYRDFYHIPQDLKIIFLAPGSYEHWPDIQPQDWEGATNFGV